MVPCCGLSNATVESYLDDIEDGLLYCQTNHPIKNTDEGMGGDLAYNQCFYPKWRSGAVMTMMNNNQRVC